MTQKLHQWLTPFLHLSDGIIVTNRSHRILAVNEGCARITGYAAEEAIGRTPTFLKSGLTPETTYLELKRALKRGRSWSGVFTNRKKDGALWHSSMTVTPFSLGRDRYYLGVFRELERLERGHYLAEHRVLDVQSSMMKLLAISAEIRDPGIEAHLVRVSLLTERLLRAHAERLGRGWDEPYAQKVVHSSLLHDIGKSCVPEGILYKPDALTSYERRIMEMHPEMGLEILKKVEPDFDKGLFMEEFTIARNIIMHHHERWDGTGYPHGLAGEAIPFEARVVSIVDVYDALVSTRPYKRAWSEPDALAFIAEQRGAFFDPALADTFLAIMSKRNCSDISHNAAPYFSL
ncbi:HD domain-containing protein [Paenibacillus sp. TRM 82003]|nr:HD domain-containing protein [Paenibacillus sp. TRM 82003]